MMKTQNSLGFQVRLSSTPASRKLLRCQAIINYVHCKSNSHQKQKLQESVEMCFPIVELRPAEAAEAAAVGCKLWPLVPDAS